MRLTHTIAFLLTLALVAAATVQLGVRVGDVLADSVLSASHLDALPSIVGDLSDRDLSRALRLEGM